MALVRIRLVADTPDDLARASVVLTAALGDRARLDRSVWRGRQGDWLAYGTLDTMETMETLRGEVDVPTDGERAEPTGRGWAR